MSVFDANLRNVVAGERESGTLCARCGREITLGEAGAICRRCGAVHHSQCWQSGGGCGSYECAGGSAHAEISTQPPLIVTHDDLAAARPLPAVARTMVEESEDSKKKGRRWNRLAVASFVLALVGIPLFGLITGLVAMVVGCVALAGHQYGRRGMALAVAGIVIGLFEVIGWSIGLYTWMDAPHMMVSLDELKIDPQSLEALPERIARAMRANVVVESGSGMRQGIGAGVILKIRDGLAHIVTNRHVIDMNYSDASTLPPDNLGSYKNIQVVTVGQQQVPATVEWIAPHNVDLAMISAPILSDNVEDAHWDENVTPHIGDNVFAIGNPHGLGWTHSAGGISQVRRQTHGDYSFRVLQTTAAINPGNSGGGLYDSEGRLIGINTLTGDKRFAEGLSFSIAFPTLLELVPASLDLPHKNLEAKPE